MHSLKNTSHKLLKSINQQKVLYLIFSEGSISRVELAHKTGLSQQTVTNIVNRLLEDGLVFEGEHMPLEAGSGRKRVALSVNSSSHYALGIEIAGKYIRGCVYNFRNERLSSTKRSVDKYKSIDNLLQLLHEVIDELLEQVPELAKTKGIGISVQGLADSKQGILLRVPGLGFLQLPLKSLLEEKYELPVYLENDANLLAVNENMNGCLSGSTDNITLKFDYGIGGAIFSDTRLISGSTFVAGEFGHYKAFTGPEAYPCHCGGTGCLTTLLSISGLQFNTGQTLEAFQQAVRSGDESMLHLHDTMIRTLAVAISNLVTFLNPDRVLLTGRVLESWGSDIVTKLKETLMESVPMTSRGVELLYMEQMPDETLLAAGLVLKHVFEIPLDALSL